MKDFKNSKELFNYLKPAFNVKIRILKNKKYFYIQIEDIWSYLKENIWVNKYGLTVSEMVNDIIHCDDMLLNNFLLNKLSLEQRESYFKS